MTFIAVAGATRAQVVRRFTDDLGPGAMTSRLRMALRREGLVNGADPAALPGRCRLRSVQPSPLKADVMTKRRPISRKLEASRSDFCFDVMVEIPKGSRNKYQRLCAAALSAVPRSRQ